METHKPTHNDETNSSTIKMAESGTMPDFVLRYGICKALHDIANTRIAKGGNLHYTHEEFISNFMRPFDDISPHTSTTNEQRSEFPAEFFQLFLGDYLKYSCCYWPELEWHMISENPSTSIIKDVVLGTSSMTREFENRSTRQLLTQAEVNMIRVTLARAEVREKQCVLDLGCGWGAAAMYILENNTQTKVVAVTNSSIQADYVKKKAQEKKVSDRLLVITCNVANLEASTYRKQITSFMGKGKFDRIYSIETFTQVRNWERLLNQLKEDWLEEGGKILVHVFAHKTNSYPFESNTFMGKYFFVGRIMPAHDLMKKLDRTVGNALEIEAEYKVNGRHYSKTCEAWLKLFYQEKGRVMRYMEQIYGEGQGKVWFNRWRVFFLTMAESTRMREGTEWFVTQYLLRTPKPKEEEVKENK